MFNDVQGQATYPSGRGHMFKPTGTVAMLVVSTPPSQSGDPEFQSRPSNLWWFESDSVNSEWPVAARL